MAEAQCPYCLEQIQQNALVCKHCKNVLKDREPPEPPKPPKDKAPPGPLWKNPTWLGAITALVAVLVAGVTPVCNVVVQTFFVEREKIDQARESSAARQRTDYLRMASAVAEGDLDAKLPVLRFLAQQDQDKKLKNWASHELDLVTNMRSKIRDARKLSRTVIKAHSKVLELLTTPATTSALNNQLKAIAVAKMNFNVAMEVVQNPTDSRATTAKSKASIARLAERTKAATAKAGTLFTTVKTSNLPTSVSGSACATCTGKLQYKCPQNFEMTSCKQSPPTKDCCKGCMLVEVTCTRRKPATKKPTPATPMTPKPIR